MATEVTAPASKQTSRKGKKAWRKNVDISTVTSGLEKVRSEIIQGGIIAEKPNSDLFAIDTAGSTTIAKTHFKTAKPLKVDEILSARSAVPALINPKKRGLQSAVGDGILPEKKRRKNGISHKELQRLRRIAYGGEDAKDQVKTSDAASGELKEFYDPWDDVLPDTEGVEKAIDSLSFIERPKKTVQPVTLRQAPIPMAGPDDESIIPAIRLPDPGISYNPEFDKWDDLITREGEKEIKEELKRLHQLEEEKRLLEAAEKSDPEISDSESEDDSENEDPTNSEFIRKMPQRKTPAQRNKVKRRKEAERLHRHQTKTEVQKRQLEAIKKLRKDIDMQIAKQHLVIKKKALTPAKRLVRRRKFDKDILPQAPLELQLPDELTDSLRKLKPEGNLMRDRFRSLRERGIVETRLAIGQKKKVKRKVTEKWSYKDWKY